MWHRHADSVAATRHGAQDPIAPHARRSGNDIQVWGPGRHIIGHNITIYHRNADKVRVAFFTEMDQMKDEALGYFDPRPWHQDRPQRPKVWGPDTLRNYWGFGSEPAIRGSDDRMRNATQLNRRAITRRAASCYVR
jgi:hypothetical protein